MSLAGTVYVLTVSGSVVADYETELGGSFRIMYYFMVAPMLATALLIYFVRAEEKKSAEAQRSSKILYLGAAVAALTLTLCAAYQIKEAKNTAGISFPASAKQRMEKYKTDMFKGRLKKFKDPNPDSTHIPYDEQAGESSWEDENSVPEEGAPEPTFEQNSRQSPDDPGDSLEPGSPDDTGDIDGIDDTDDSPDETEDFDEE